MEHYLGAKIKELRQGRNWTQSYLAARLNKSVSTVSGYESDAHHIPTDVLISIAELFGVSLDVLLDLEKPTCVSTQGLSISQIEVVEALVQEFRSPTSTGSDFSEAKMKILHDIFDNFCEPK